MEEGLFGFHIRFEGQSEHYIVLERHQELRVEHLSALQLRMLETGRIPGVLPLYVYEINDKVRLQYGISGKTMLYYALRLRQPTERDLLLLLKSIVATLGDSLEFMLHETGYFIHERLVFIDDGWEETQLVYVPSRLEDVPSLRDQFERFIGVLADFMRVGATIGSSDLTDLTALQHFCRHPEWSLTGFRQKLVEMDRTSLRPFGQPVQDAAEHEQVYEILKAPQPLPEEEKSSSLPPEKKTQTPFKNKFILFVAIFICVCAWMLHASDATEHSIYIGFGATFLLIAAIVFAMPAKMFEGRLRVIGYSDQADEGLFFFKNEDGPLKEDKLKAMPYSVNREKEIEEYYRKLGNRTALLPQQDAPMLTVALDLGSVLGSKHVPKPKPMLELWRNHVQERVPIDSDPFLIGRGDTGVNLAIPAPDVSRVHAEICIEMDGVAIRDLKAKNGTTLNDLSLVPYERYTLSDGDVIGIGAYKLVFKLIGA